MSASAWGYTPAVRRLPRTATTASPFTAPRICSAAHGGQILLSQTTQSLLEDEEEEELPGVDLRDLGMHRFKGFDRPDRVYQVVADGLESAFPPLRSEAAEKPDEGKRQDQLLAAAGHTALIAEDEARALGHDFLATEHLLLAVLREQETLGARVLGTLGVSYADIRPIVEQLGVIATSREGIAPARLPLTPRTMSALELAMHEALLFGVDVHGEHVLLGIARERSCVGARLLLDWGVDEQTLRREVMAALSGPSGSGSPPRSARGRIRSLWRSAHGM